MQNLFRSNNYHNAFRMQLISTLVRIKFNKIVNSKSTSIQKIMGFKVTPLDLRTLCTLFDEIFVEGSYYIDIDNEQPEIVDCGSNIGMAILFFKKLFPRCKVTAFEPDLQTFTTLLKNIAVNKLSDVKAYNVAVSNEEGEISFYSDPKVPGSGLMSIIDARSDMGNEIRVKTVKLSSYISREIDLLKLDVEGAENQVFQDLDESGKLALVKNMIIEYHHHMRANDDNLSYILSTLERNGFGYQLSDTLRLPFVKNVYQVGLIYAYKK